MKKILFFLLIISFGFQVNNTGQSYPESLEDFNEAQYFFNRGDYEDAIYFYLKLVDYDSENANFNFKVGECYLNIPGKEHFAIPYFENALKNIVPKKKYNKKIYDERAAPLHVYFYLGNAYRMDDQLNKALQCYSKFIDSPFFWGNYNQEVVEQEIKSCERAKIIQDDPIEIEKINLGKNINTQNAEEQPVISGDGKTIVFVRRLKFYDAIFYSMKNDSGWVPAVNINPQIHSDGEFYPTGLSYDGKQLLLIKKEEENGDIYISNLEGGLWSKALRMDNKINSTGMESFASFSNDGKSIYLSSNRSGGKGSFDIYCSRLSSEGRWGRPKNMGKIINTEFDEQNPISCNNDHVLFFSSKGHYNIGGFDIFYSSLKDRKWSNPINIGFPLNNTRDNLLFYPTEQCRQGYYAMDDSSGFGQSDIYLIIIKAAAILNFENTPDEK